MFVCKGVQSAMLVLCNYVSLLVRCLCKKCSSQLPRQAFMPDIRRRARADQHDCLSIHFSSLFFYNVAFILYRIRNGDMTIKYQEQMHDS